MLLFLQIHEFDLKLYCYQVLIECGYFLFFISQFGKQWSHRYQVLKDPEGPGHVDILRNAY